jgi:hypothetical protein
MVNAAVPLPAHLLGESWHIADLLLYGGAGIGFVFGTGLFLWGRVERWQQRAITAGVDRAGDASNRQNGEAIRGEESRPRAKSQQPEAKS